MCIFSLALFYYTDEKKKNLLLCMLFILPCMVWVFRTSIMGTTLALMAFFFFKYKLKSLPVIFAVFVLFIVAVFAIPRYGRRCLRIARMYLSNSCSGAKFRKTILIVMLVLPCGKIYKVGFIKEKN